MAGKYEGSDVELELRDSSGVRRAKGGDASQNSHRGNVELVEHITAN